jgi:hypothetical protein
MKMKNDDVKRITQIKQYLLDPPASFRLYDYAVNYLQDAIAVLTAYPEGGTAIEDLQHFLQQLQQDKNIPQEELKSRLQDAGKKLSRLTSQ